MKNKKIISWEGKNCIEPIAGNKVRTVTNLTSDKEEPPVETEGC